MPISAVANAAYPSGSLAAPRQVAGGVAGTSSAPASPAVINNVKSSASGQAVTASDIQSQVNGINRLIDLFGHVDWAMLVKQGGVAAVAAGQQQLLTNLQLAEGDTIASAGKAAVSGVDFTFHQPNASVLLPYSQASGAATATAQPTENAAAATPPPTSTPRSAVHSTYSQTNLPSGLISQPASIATETRATLALNASTLAQSHGASVALALLEASSSSNPARTPYALAAQKQDFYV